MKIKDEINNVGAGPVSAPKGISTRHKPFVRIVNATTGITLIALVITVIILLILAGVVINFALGNDGFFNKINQAKEEYQIEQAREKLSLLIGEYEVKMREETLYHILSLAEGVEIIEPSSEEEGFPYKIIVDGYLFEITQDLEINYLQKADSTLGQAPEIEEVAKQIESKTQAKITIKAKTKDEAGIVKVIVFHNGINIQEIDINSEKKIEQDIVVSSNGEYCIKVVGGNKRTDTSEVIKITELETISATLQAGNVINGNVVLTAKVSAEKGTIENIKIIKKEIKNEIETTTEIGNYSYTNQNKTELTKEQTDENLPFYENETYYAIITMNNEETVTSNEVTVKNTTTVATARDIQKLSEVVNKGEDNFNRKAIHQLNDITVNNHISIGTLENPYKGQYWGDGHELNITVNSSSECQGFFGYVEDARIQNFILGNGKITGANKVGGAVGYAKNSIIGQITNKATQVETTGVYGETGTEATYYYFGTKTTSWEHTTDATMGGICGKAENTPIHSCEMRCDITKTNEGKLIGGIVGYFKSYGSSSFIRDCNNRGDIRSNDSHIGGIAGAIYGNATVERCNNYRRYP